MRPVTVDERNRLSAPHFHIHARLEILNGDGIWIDVTNLAGKNWFYSARWSFGLDNAVPTGTIALRRRIGTDSLAPEMRASALNKLADNSYSPLVYPAAQMRFSTAITLPDIAPVSADWKRVVFGKIDKVSWGDRDNKVEFAFSGIESFITAAFIEEEQLYSDALGMAVEDLIQQIFNANVAVETWTTLHTPVSPNWFRTAFRIEPNINTYEAARTLAIQIGWDLRWRFINNTDYVPVLSRPDRTLAAADATIGPSEYENIPDIGIGDQDVRNKVRVDFWNSATGLPDSITEIDQASIDKFRKRFMALGESNPDSNIDNATEAQTLAETVISDVAWPVLDHATRLRYWWPVDINDILDFPANGEHYDLPQRLAVHNVEHVIEGLDGTTTIHTAGKPASARSVWIRKAQEIPEVLSDRPVVAIRVLNSTRVDQTVQISAENPTGAAIRLEYRIGDGPWISQEGPSPQVAQVILPRSTQGQNHVLYTRTTALDTGFITDIPYSADWDTLPKVLTYNQAPLLDAEGNQIGWRITAPVDDDTNSLVVEKADGEFTITGTTTHDTSSAKVITNDILQTYGQHGTLRLRPFSNLSGTGVEGQSTEIHLIIRPISTITTKPLTTTKEEIIVETNPPNCEVLFREHFEGTNSPAFTTALAPVRRVVNRHDTLGTIFEWYCRVINGPGENKINRLWLDPDTAANTTLTVSETGGRVTPTLNLDDEDIARWELYSREGVGIWPTVDGSQTSELDPLCLRDFATGRRQPRSFYLPDGTHNFVAVAYDDSNTAGLRVFLTKVIDTSTPPPPTPTISSPGAMLHPQTPPHTTHRVTWIADAANTVDNYVKIFERIQYGTDWAEIGQVAATDESFVSPTGFAAYFPDGDSGAYLTWEYRMDLYGLSGFIQSISASISGHYIP